MTDAENTTSNPAPSRRRNVVTVLILIGLIVISILIGIFSVLWGGPVEPPPGSFAPGLPLASTIGGLL